MGYFRNIAKKIKNRETPFFSALKSVMLFIRNFHIPLFWPFTWIYKFLYYVCMFTKESGRIIFKIFYSEPMFRSRCKRSGRNLRLERLPYIAGNGSIEIGDDVNISGQIGIGFNDRFKESPRFVVGNNVFIGHMSGFAAAKMIEIGNNCYISTMVKVFDNDGHPLDPSKRIAGEPISEEQAEPVRICDNVWIGCSAIILKGVTVGRNSIIGAGSVVVKDVPPDCVVAGNPAVVVKDIKQEEVEVIV